MCGIVTIRISLCVCVCVRAELYKVPQEFVCRLLYSHRLNVVCHVCLFEDNVSGSAAPPQTALTLMLTSQH
jgi:hypothetical protein